jgi:hypothetical protein
MKHAKPLLYLTFKSFVNSMRRALTSPKRLISLLFFIGYYFMLFIRPALTPKMGASLPPNLMGRFSFPPLQMLDGFIFLLFAAFSMLLLVGMAGYQGGFRPADVDVLFPTPISPKLVLVFRMARDYLFTLLTPFFIAILGLRGAKLGWEAIFNNLPHPEYSGLALRAITIAWFLMAMGFVAITHAVSLFINRSDRRSDRNKQILSLSLGVGTAAVVAYTFWFFSETRDLQHVIAFAHLPALRLVFFIASFATEMTMAPFYGSVTMAALGIAGLFGVIVLSFRVAVGQVEWLYDQAAVKGFSSSRQRDLQRSGDYMGLMAERARSGKLKSPRRTWIHRLKLQGAKALLWKELLLQPRSMLPLLLILMGMQVVVSLLPAAMKSPMSRPQEAGYLLIAMQGFLTLSVTLALAQTGFIEILRRVDLQKPLPFPPAKIVFFEIVSKSVFGIVASWVGTLAFTILSPELWSYAVAAALFTPALSLLFSTTTFFVTMLFPDLDDPSQRQFRALMTLLGIAIGGFFPVVTLVGLLAVGLNPVLSSIAAAAIALGISLVLSAVAGHLYAGFNPSE